LGSSEEGTVALKPRMRDGASPSGPPLGVSSESEVSLSTASRMAREDEVARPGKLVIVAGKEVGSRRRGYGEAGRVRGRLALWLLAALRKRGCISDGATV